MKLLSRLFGKRASKDASVVTARAPLFERLEDRQLLSTVQYAPSAPSNLTASASSSTAIALHWSDNSTRETGYKIERSTDDKTFTQINTVGANVTSYTSGNLTKGKKYYYKVCAYEGSLNSTFTNVASATPGTSSGSSVSSTTVSTTTPPQAPTGLTASVVSSTSVKLTWKDNSTRETGYKVEYSSDGGKTYTRIALLGANSTSYTATGLKSGTKYLFYVYAYEGSVNSIATNTVSITPGSSSSSSSGTSKGSSSSSTTVSSGVDSSNFAGVTIDTSESPSKLIPILNKLHVKTVRMFFGMLTWENRGGDASLEQAKEYKNAGFNVIMDVDAPQVPSYSEATSFFEYIRNKPGALSDVNIWEIGNEPDRPPFWQGTASQYVNTILKAAWTVLHPAGAKILGAGPSWSPDYAQEMVDAGYLKYCDYAGMHPYGDSVQQVVERATEAAKVYAGKPMILSEWNVRGATSQSQWISELNQIAPQLKKVANEAIYFALVKGSTMAGASGLINPDGSPNGGYYSMYENWYS